MGVCQLGYLVLDTSNIEAWRDLAASIMGAEERRDSGSDQVRLRFDERHHRITLRPASTDSIAAIGWEAPSLGELASIRRKLAERGIAVTDGTGQQLADRRVGALICFRDADGFPMEICCGPSVDDAPFRPARPISGFNCGPLGLGHVVLVTKDRESAARFYQDVLGFSVTDYIAWDEADAIFLHCNPRHHSLALLNECYGMTSGYMHHFMLETRALEDVGRAYDMVRSRKLPLVFSLGQHSNDRMTSFYMKTPSGFAMEYGWGGVLVDDAVWQVQHYSTPKIWGHESLV